MSVFTHNLFGIGNICDKYCKVLFTKNLVIIYGRNNQPFLKGWRETYGARMWRILLRTDLRMDLAVHPDIKIPRLILKKKKPLLKHLAYMTCHP